MAALVRLCGGIYSFCLVCDKATVNELAELLGRSIDGIMIRSLGGQRGDQAINGIKKGSLLVELQCFTDERFMEVWEDYQSGKLKKCFQEEFSACEIEVEGLKIDIKNLEEVNETRAQIESRKKRIAEAPKTGMEGHQRRMSPRIIVQGGAYNAIYFHKDKLIEGIKRAAKGGYSVLKEEGKTAVDAAEEAVRIMENDGYFNAGRGAFFNGKGDVELDAMIMDGHTMETGAVMALRYFNNPVSLARKVMEKTPHCALSAEGALKFAHEIGFWTRDPENRITNEASLRVNISQNDFEQFVRYHYQDRPIGGDTVNAIAMDANGHLACATSTGGIPGKREGRISDAPLVGCGGYANEFGAAASSGHGEALMKMTLARDVVFNMENELNAQESAEKSVRRMQERVRGYGGTIAIDKNGNFGKAFNTEVMIWASVKDEELSYGMERDECQIEPV